MDLRIRPNQPQSMALNSCYSNGTITHVTKVKYSQYTLYHLCMSFPASKFQVAFTMYALFPPAWSAIWPPESCHAYRGQSPFHQYFGQREKRLEISEGLRCAGLKIGKITRDSTHAWVWYR